VFASDFVQQVFRELIYILFGGIFVGESESREMRRNRGGIEGRLEVDLWTAGDENADTDTEWGVM